MAGEKTLIRLGDKSDHGGTMITAGAHFTNRGIHGCIDGDQHSCPIPHHGITRVTATSVKTKTNGKAILRSGDVADCGAVLLPSDSNAQCG